VYFRDHWSRLQNRNLITHPHHCLSTGHRVIFSM
jgi:hypothetical protein